MRIKIFFVFVLGLITIAQGQSVSEKAAMKKKRAEQANKRGLENAGKMSTAAKDKLGKIIKNAEGEVRDKINAGCKGLTEAKLKANVPMADMNIVISERCIANMEQTELDKIVENTDYPKRVRQNIKYWMAMENLSDNDSNKAMTDSRESEAMKHIAAQKENDKIMDWTEKDVSEKSDFLHKLDHGKLMKIKDKAAGKKVCRVLMECASKSACKMKSSPEIQIKRCVKTYFGDVKKFTGEDIEDTLKYLGPAELKQLSKEQITDSENRLKELNKLCQPCQKVVLMMLMKFYGKGKEDDELTLRDFQDMVSKVGKQFEKLITDEMIPEKLKKDSKYPGSSVENLLKNNKKLRMDKGELTIKEKKQGVKDALKNGINKDTDRVYIEAVPCREIEQAIAKGDFTISQLKDLFKGGKNTKRNNKRCKKCGAGILKEIRSKSFNQNDVPDCLTDQLSSSDMDGMSSRDKKNLCNRKGVKFNGHTKTMCAIDVPLADQDKADEEVKENVPLQKCEDVSASSVRAFVEGTPAPSPCGSAYAAKATDGEDTLSLAVLNDEAVAVNSDFKMIKSIDAKKIMEYTKKLNNPPPTSLKQTQCRQFKDKFVEYSKQNGAETEMDACMTLSMDEASDMIPCALVLLGGDCFKQMPENIQIIIINKLIEIPPKNNSPRNLLEIIVGIALQIDGNAPSDNKALTSDNIVYLDNLIIYAPIDMIKSITDMTVRKDYLDTMAKYFCEEDVPCLTNAMYDDIESKILEVLGDLQSLEPSELEPYKCLLFTLSKTNLREINKYAMASMEFEKEKTLPTAYIEYKEIFCEADSDGVERYEEGMKNVYEIFEDVTYELYLDAKNDDGEKKRRRRAVSDDTTCDEIEYKDANVISVTKMAAMTDDETFDCISFICNSKLEGDRCMTVKKKIKNKKDFKDYTKEEQQTFSCLAYCMTEGEINELDLSDVSTAQAYAGKEDLPKNLMKKVAENIQKKFKKFEDMDSPTLAAVAGALTEAPIEDVKNIKSETIVPALPALRNVDFGRVACRVILEKCMEEYGKPEKFTKAIVLEMGKFAGCMDPEECKKMTPEAAGGMVPEAIETMDLQVVKVITEKQMNAFSIETALTFSPEQVNALESGVKELLNSIKDVITRLLENSASGLMLSYGMMTLILIIKLFL